VGEAQEVVGLGIGRIEGQGAQAVLPQLRPATALAAEGGQLPMGRGVGVPCRDPGAQEGFRLVQLAAGDQGVNSGGISGGEVV
jgi:hypothetical protein